MADKDELNRMCPIATRINNSQGLGSWSQDGQVLDAELAADHAIGVTWDTEVDGDLDNMNDYLYFLSERDGVCGGDAAAAAGSTDVTRAQVVGPVWYRIGGKLYCQEAAEGDLALDGNKITRDLYGAFRIELNATGTVSTKASLSTGDMGFSSAEDALLSLASGARTTGTIDAAYLVIQASSVGFTMGTNTPTTGQYGCTSATYYDARVPMIDNGLNAAMSVGVTIGTIPDEYAHGTVDARTNGLNVTQMAADTTKAFTQADVIGTTNLWGGHLLVTSLDGTTIVTLPTSGEAGSALTMRMATQVAVGTSLDEVQVRLPLLFTPIGRIVTQSLKHTFTFNTDDIGGTDGQAIYESTQFGEFDRTVTSGKNIQNDAPTIPATVTAPLIGTLRATVPPTLE